MPLTVTAASVLATSSATKLIGTAGATLSRGKPIYLDTSTNTFKLSDANLAGAKTCNGIALVDSASGQPTVYVALDATFTPGATLVSGTTYAVGGTAGEIVAVSELSSGDTAIILGVAISTTQMNLNITLGGAI